MSTNLATMSKETRLAIPAPEFSNEQIKLLAETVAKGCDQNELAFFLQVAKLKRLDPFTGQIHVVKRWDSTLGKEKITVQVGVDGYRAIASRTGDLAGIDDPEYDTETDEHPNWAKITVYRYGRGDEKVPYRATARWGEYVQVYKDKQTGELKPNPMWKKMPFLMLGKVAEALALRKAFPDELSGMYTNEEMGQADNEGVIPAPTGKPPVSMPKSTDEKKAAPKAEPKPDPQQGKAETTKQNATQQATTQQAVPEGEKITGEIKEAKTGSGTAEGILFLIVGGKLVSVPVSMVSKDMVVGATITLTATKRTTGKSEQWMTTAVEKIELPVQEGQIVDAEFTEAPPATESVEEHQSAMKAVGDDLFGKQEAQPQTTMDPPPADTAATKPGTAGLKRAQRLHTLITQNWRNTGFTEDHLARYMKQCRVEHARDLKCPPKGSEDFNQYEYACGMATGENDWHEVLGDE